MDKIFNDKKKISVLLFWSLLILAILLRIGKFFVGDNGLNQDEASIGYDAYALLNYGIDRNGTSLPVHLIAWGSGQNALYAYLSMPFIAIFGLTAFSVRIVNFLFSVGTVAAVYCLCNDLFGKRVAFISMALTAIAPWNIMLATWGLESNLLPAMFILAVLLLVKSFKKPWLICFSAAMFSLCLYTYGSAYTAVPVFMLLAVITVIRQRLVPFKWVLIAFGIFVIMSVPIGLFVIINKFGLDSINIGSVTIPAMTGKARLNEILGANPKEIIKGLWRTVIAQYDGITQNAISGFGCIYLISLPFTICGFIELIRQKSIGAKLLIYSIIGSLTIFITLSGVNINRANIIYLPLIIITAVGINSLIKSKQAAVAVISAYAVMLCGFTATFYGESYTSRIKSERCASFGDAIKYADEISGGKTVYVTDNVNMPYIYVLFYTKADPNKYIETVEFEDVDVQFQWVTSFDKWVFDTDRFNELKSGIYIVNNYEVDFEKDYKVVQFEKYSVVTIE